MTYRQGADERAGPNAPIEVAIGVASDSQFYADLSGRVLGVFASTFLVLARDTPVQLVVSLTTGATFLAWGAVQFVRSAGDEQLPGLGVAFTKVDARDLEAVGAFCQQLRAPMLFDEG